MKNLLMVLALLFLPAAHAFDFATALAAASSRPDTVNSKLALLTAQNDRVRVDGDPLALRANRVQARQSVELAQARYEQAAFDAVVEIANAYTGALGGRAQLALAEKGLAMAEEGLEIAKIRLANGSATILDVQEAEVAVERARQSLVAARKGLGVALANLEGMVGLEIDPATLEGIPDDFLLPIPSLEAAQAAITGHPDLLQTGQGLELARLSVDTLDPRYASQAQIDAARTQLETTEELIPEVRRGFDLQARNLVLQAENAADSYRVQQEAMANARERFDVQRERYDSGVISRVQLEQFELELRQSELATLQARNGYLTSLLGLQAGAMLPLAAPIAEALDMPAAHPSGTTPAVDDADAGSRDDAAGSEETSTDDGE